MVCPPHWMDERAGAISTRARPAWRMFLSETAGKEADSMEATTRIWWNAALAVLPR